MPESRLKTGRVNSFHAAIEGIIKSGPIGYSGIASTFDITEKTARERFGNPGSQLYTYIDQLIDLMEMEGDYCPLDILAQQCNCVVIPLDPNEHNIIHKDEIIHAITQIADKLGIEIRRTDNKSTPHIESPTKPEKFGSRHHQP